MVANTFQAVGAALLCLFLFAIWPPLILLGAGAFLLLFGFVLETNDSLEDGE